jgi:Glyoxalase-like domain
MGCADLWARHIARITALAKSRLEKPGQSARCASHQRQLAEAGFTWAKGLIKLQMNKPEKGMYLDHLAVAAPTLDEAGAAIEAALGVTLQPGGQHPVFGTHNRLLGLDDGLYLEAIAIDPAAADPGRARWFDLDGFQGPARLSNWICRTDDLGAELANLPVGAGVPVQLSRGDLRWRMAVPADGRLPFDNLFPALIQWQGRLHPATMLAPSGCALRRLVVTHPRADELRALLPLNDPRVVFETGPPALKAEIDTPHGRRVLR